MVEKKTKYTYYCRSLERKTYVERINCLMSKKSLYPKALYFRKEVGKLWWHPSVSVFPPSVASHLPYDTFSGVPINHLPHLLIVPTFMLILHKAAILEWTPTSSFLIFLLEHKLIISHFFPILLFCQRHNNLLIIKTIELIQV